MNDDFEQEFREFKSNILEYVGGLKEWQKTTVEYRQALCDKLDKVMTRIDTINERCISKIPVYEASLQYIKDDKKRRSIWRDRGFQVFVVILTGAITMFGIILNHSLSSKVEASRVQEQRFIENIK